MSKHVPPVGELLKKARTDKGFTIQLVADFVGIKMSFLSDIERGKRPPPRYDILLKLGLYLGITERDLMWSAAQWYLKIAREERKVTKDAHL